jgi:hypothetical protein
MLVCNYALVRILVLRFVIPYARKLLQDVHDSLEDEGYSMREYVRMLPRYDMRTGNTTLHLT